MTTADQAERARRRMLALIEDSGLPAPDEVAFRGATVEFRWEEQRVLVIVELDDFNEADAMDLYTREGITA